MNPFLDTYLLLSAALSLLLGWFWIVFQIYMLFRVVRRIDPIVDPCEDKVIAHRGESLFLRWHRLSVYSVSACSRSCNIRVYPDYDFTELPGRYRWRLQVNAYVLCFGAFFMVTGWLAGKVTGNL